MSVRQTSKFFCRRDVSTGVLLYKTYTSELVVEVGKSVTKSRNNVQSKWLSLGSPEGATTGLEFAHPNITRCEWLLR